jgi:hypothetical protein
MAKYEAVINLTVEVDAKFSTEADRVIYGEFMDRLLDTASRDAKFKLWADVIQIEQIRSNNA